MNEVRQSSAERPLSDRVTLGESDDGTDSRKLLETALRLFKPVIESIQPVRTIFVNEVVALSLEIAQELRPVVKPRRTQPAALSRLRRNIRRRPDS